EHLRAGVSLSIEGPGQEAIFRLFAAAQRMRKLDPELGHDALVEELRLMHYATRETAKAVGEAIGDSSAAPTDRPAELILRGWAQLAQHGFPAGVDLCAQAARALCEKPSHEESDLPLLTFSCAWATSFWDLEVLRLLAGRAVQLARDCGAL